MMGVHCNTLDRKFFLYAANADGTVVITILMVNVEVSRMQYIITSVAVQISQKYSYRSVYSNMYE